jgi:hypothetical protein
MQFAWKEGILTLPIHDCLLCKAKDSSEVAKFMRWACYDVLGSYAFPVKRSNALVEGKAQVS